MPEYVRVKQKETGHELSVTAGHFAAVGDEAYTRLDKPATDAAGDPLPAKYKTTVSSEAAKKKAPSGQKADSEKENS